MRDWGWRFLVSIFFMLYVCTYSFLMISPFLTNEIVNFYFFTASHLQRGRARNSDLFLASIHGPFDRDSPSLTSWTSATFIRAEESRAWMKGPA